MGRARRPSRDRERCRHDAALGRTLAVLDASWLHPAGYDVRIELVAEDAAFTGGLSPPDTDRHADWPVEVLNRGAATSSASSRLSGRAGRLPCLLPRDPATVGDRARDGLEAMRIAWPPRDRTWVGARSRSTRSPASPGGRWRDASRTARSRAHRGDALGILTEIVDPEPLTVADVDLNARRVGSGRHRRELRERRRGDRRRRCARHRREQAHPSAHPRRPGASASRSSARSHWPWTFMRRAAGRGDRGLGIQFQLGFQRRFDAAYGEARRLVRAASWPLYVLRLAGHDPEPPAARRTPAASGGIFNDFSVHDFDVTALLTGQEIVEVTPMATSRVRVFAKYERRRDGGGDPAAVGGDARDPVAHAA